MMVATDRWGRLADRAAVERTMAALERNGMCPHYVATGQEARRLVFGLLPAGAEVLDMTSQTLRQAGIAAEIQESGRYDSIRKRLMAMDRATHSLEMQRLGAAPAWVVGSVHAVTEDGKVVIASMTGSQLAAYASGASHVIWVVGTQKIVKDLNQAFQRIEEHCFPLEDQRANDAYGTGSSVNKLLVVQREVRPGRINIILVGEHLGF